MRSGGQSQNNVPNQHQNLNEEAKVARWPPQKRMKNWKLYKEAKLKKTRAHNPNTVKNRKFS